VFLLSSVREDMFLLHPFGLDTRTKVTFTPTVFLEDATLLRKDLVTLILFPILSLIWTRCASVAETFSK
jgi:hypothetical protein